MHWQYGMNNINFPHNIILSGPTGSEIERRFIIAQYWSLDYNAELTPHATQSDARLPWRWPYGRGRGRQAGRPGPRSLPACRTVVARASPRPRLRCVSPYSEGGPSHASTTTPDAVTARRAQHHPAAASVRAAGSRYVSALGHLEDLGVNGNIRLKWFFKENEVVGACSTYGGQGGA
jgi:hypothetical protein